MLNTSVLVMAEIVWTLGSFYKLSRPEIRDKVLAMLNTAGLSVENSGLVAPVVSLFADRNVDFVDAYNALRMPAHGLEQMVTFDTRHISRLPRKAALTPDKVRELLRTTEPPKPPPCKGDAAASPLCVGSHEDSQLPFPGGSDISARGCWAGTGAGRPVECVRTRVASHRRVSRIEAIRGSICDQGVCSADVLSRRTTSRSGHHRRHRTSGIR